MPKREQRRRTGKKHDVCFMTWFCFSGDFFYFFGPTKVPFGDYFLFFLGFLSKSKMMVFLIGWYIVKMSYEFYVQSDFVVKKKRLELKAGSGVVNQNTSFSPKGPNLLRRGQKLPITTLQNGKELLLLSRILRKRKETASFPVKSYHYSLWKLESTPKIRAIFIGFWKPRVIQNHRKTPPKLPQNSKTPPNHRKSPPKLPKSFPKTPKLPKTPQNSPKNSPNHRKTPPKNRPPPRRWGFPWRFDGAVSILLRPSAPRAILLRGVGEL